MERWSAFVPPGSMSKLSREGTTEVAGQRLLCVDDDPEILKLRKLLLESSGYSVVTATSGEAGLEVLAQGPGVDLVLLDYLMPGMKGDELAQELRRKYPRLPLVAVSAVGQLPRSLLDATDATIQKGQDPEVLLSTISTILGREAGSEGKAEASRTVSTKTILCVEDEPLQLKLRKSLFESAGYVVLTAGSANAALEIFRGKHIDAVVMDYWMSGQKGTELAEEMKKMRPRIPIVILSGFTSLPGETSVVDSWLRKAEIEPEDLLHEVERLIELRTRIQPSSKPS